MPANEFHRFLTPEEVQHRDLREKAQQLSANVQEFLGTSRDADLLRQAIDFAAQIDVYVNGKAKRDAVHKAARRLSELEVMAERSEAA